MGANPLCHSNNEWEGGGGRQETPPTCVTSKGVCRMCAIPPTRVSSRGEWAQMPSVTQIASGRVVVGRQSLPLEFRVREVVLVDVEDGVSGGSDG